jgi:hypothetical protein
MAGRVGILKMETMTPLEMLGRGSERGWLEAFLNNPETIFSTDYETFEVMKTYNEMIWRESYPATLELPSKMISSYFASYLLTLRAKRC